MDMRTNVSLADFTTMRLGGLARFFADAHTLEDIDRLCKAAQQHRLPIFILGGGSNTLATDDGFNGVVIRNCLKGFEVLEQTSDFVTIRVAGGENWDETVKKTVDMELSGIEALSGIPGTVGAAPVQNISAYGQEVGSVITELSAYNIITGTVEVLQNLDCAFSYRSSIFREKAQGHYAILSVTMRLSTARPQPPFYSAVEDYLTQNGIRDINVHTIRDAVLDIRLHKLPDPAQRPNAGSFFKNAIVERWRCDELLAAYPNMPYYPMPDNACKIPTGWLIDTLGYKGKLLHGIRVHDKNALVLINESASSYTDLIATRDEIAGAVRDTFQISIEQEPLVLSNQ